MRLTFSTLVAAAAVVTAGCADSTMSTGPSPSAPSSLRADKGGNDKTKTVKIMDECDGRSFTANGVACSRKGGVTFDHFIAQLTKLQQVPEWKFAPGNVNLRVGDILASLNTGGETHTFTEVEEFGGGIVPILNTLSGNTKVAPECSDPGALTFLQPGQGTSEVTDEAGDEKYQCCIHPWMRTVVHIAQK